MVALVVFLTAACGRIEEPRPEPEIVEPAADTESEADSDAGAGLTYRVEVVEGLRRLNALRDEVGREAFEAVLMVNRLDLRNVRKGESLVIPLKDNGGIDIQALSPFPARLAPADDVTKLLLVSQRVQAFGAYEKGELVRWGPTSSGKKSTPTPGGLFHANWKARITTSTVNPSWILPWNVNIHNFDGISIHQYDLPGYPASHSCVRLREEDARWVHDWVEQWILSPDGSRVLAHGTPVLIFGEYDFSDEAPPWKLLSQDPSAADVSIREITDSLAPHLDLIRSRAGARTELLEDRDPVVVP